jgi:hypothetical protein
MIYVVRKKINNQYNVRKGNASQSLWLAPAPASASLPSHYVLVVRTHACSRRKHKTPGLKASGAVLTKFPREFRRRVLGLQVRILQFFSFFAETRVEKFLTPRVSRGC